MNLKSNYSFVVMAAAAFIMSVGGFVVAISAKRNITPVEGGLFAASAAVIILGLRVVYLDKRLSELEKKINGENSRTDKQ